VAFYTVRDRFLDAIHPHVEMKKLASLFPNLFELATPYGFVASMDETGEAFASYQDPEGTHIRGITSVEEFGGHLYLGTLHRDSIGRFALP
jgi:hypothetical protein